MNDFCQFTRVYSDEQTRLISQEFSRLNGQHYLEHAGATLYSEKQIENICADLQLNLLANPHAKNLSSKITDDAIDVIRFQILSHFKTDPQEYSIIFTSGATQALKLVGETFKYKGINGANSKCCGCNGSLVYLQDNHTSVLGMRQYTDDNSSTCLSINEAVDALSKRTPTIRQEKQCTSYQHHQTNCLFVYPAQSNFSGTKYPLSWIDQVQNGALNKIRPQVDSQNWFVLLDAASYVATNQLNLAVFKPDFVTISFYKMFGYPTGLGALLVRNASGHVLEKKYFGGGSVLMAQPMTRIAVFRKSLHERFEDGTLPFLSIVSLRHGFDTINRLQLNFDQISRHTFHLGQYVYRSLQTLHHWNDAPVAILYHHTQFEDIANQGGIINFNLLRPNGDYVGYSEVLHISNLYNVHLRTGCFCNQGACQYFLGLSTDDIQRNFEAGHVCGDQNDLLNGKPTGSIRISFGYMSTKADTDKFLEMIENCFVVGPMIKKIATKPPSAHLFKLSHSEQISTFGNNKHCNNDHHHSSKWRSNMDDKSTECRHCVDGVLENIFLFPVKSCAAFSVPLQWQLTTTGLKYDREWMIINSAGVCLTQKMEKKLCLIRPAIDLQANTLTLRYFEHSKISVPLNPTDLHRKNSGSVCHSKVCGDKIQGWDCGDEVADWLCNILQSSGLRLLKQCSEEEATGRTSKKSKNLQLSLANKAQYLLVNKKSVEWLRDRIPNENEFSEDFDLTVHRFRANFVVKFDDPFVENDCVEFEFDEIKFEACGKCTRCQMICIDQMTGKATKEPLQTLSREFKGSVSFGVYLNRFDVNNKNVCLAIGSKVKGRKIEE